MPTAPTVIARVDQALQWAQKEFPTAYPVRVEWRAKLPIKPGKGVTVEDVRSGYWAETVRRRRTFVILMSRRRLRQYEVAIDTFLHEYAHAMTWGPAVLETRAEPHRGAWPIAYGDLYASWTDDHGWELSREFLWRRR